LWLVQLQSPQVGTGKYSYAALELYFTSEAGDDKAQNLGKLFGRHLAPKWRGDAVRLIPRLVRDRYLLIGSPSRSGLLALDLEAGTHVLVDSAYQGDLMNELHVTADSRHLVQVNSDGQFVVYQLDSGTQLARGRIVDDEYLIYTQQGYYRASYEGAHYVYLNFPGIEGLHSFHQFAAVLKRPDIVDSALAGRKLRERPQLSAPPVVALRLAKRDGFAPTVQIQARSVAGLRSLRIYQDGQLTHSIPLTGNSAHRALSLERLNNARWITAQAVDEKRFLSRPASTFLADSGEPGGRLLGLNVGVDAYQDPRIAPLSFAVSDTRNLTRALEANLDRYYRRVELRRLIDEEATPEAIMETLDQIIRRAEPGDTVVFSFSGHGVRNRGGDFFLATSGTESKHLDQTALPWSRIAKSLSKAKSRVLVFLDACHAGLAGEHLASNDEAAAALMNRMSAPLLILAASKGRQYSQEWEELNGGVFTAGIVDVLEKNRNQYDRNENGVIEISELFAGLKAFVSIKTQGAQTPWLARTDLVGNFALF
jgi:hypothetical protein